MADKIELKVPDVGGEEVEVIEILVSAGDTIEKEDGVVTVESDKASMDIPASEGGKIVELKVKEGDTIKEGDVLAIIEAASDDSADEEADDSDDDKAEDTAKESSSDGSSSDASEDDDDAQDDQQQEAASGGESEVIDVEVPDIGDEEDVEIIEILVNKGDSVEKEDGLITLETDKATMDVPCPEDGEVEEMLVKVGDKVSQGSKIAKLKVTRSGGGSRMSLKATLIFYLFLAQYKLLLKIIALKNGVISQMKDLNFLL